MTDPDLTQLWPAWQQEMQQSLNIILNRKDVQFEIKSTLHEANPITAYATFLADTGPLVVIGDGFFAHVVSTGREAYGLFKGVVYHELSHLKWSPFGGYFHAPLRKLDSTYGGKDFVNQVYNVMEDNRVELASAAKWLPMRRYFRIVVAHLLNQFVEEGDGTWQPAALDYLLFAFRTGVPSSVRQAMRQEFDDTIGQGSADEADQILKDYFATDPKQDPITAVKLIGDMLDLIHDDTTEDDWSSAPSTSFDSGDQPSNEGTSDEAGVIDKMLQVSAKNAEGNAASGESSGSLSQDIEEELAAAEGDKKVQNDSKQTHESVMQRAGKGADLAEVFDHERHQSLVVTSDMYAAERMVMQQLSKLRRALDDEWTPDVTGKLDGRAYATRSLYPGRDFFRTFEQGGEKAGSSHLVLAIDTSGSMHGHRINEVSKLAWVLSRSFFAIDSKLDVLLFNSDTVFADPALSPNRYPVYEARGGTMAAESASAAEATLLRSPAAHRFFIALSDGEWFDDTLAERHIEKLNHAGVQTGHFTVGSTNHNTHKAKFGGPVDSAMELLPVITSLVAGALASARRR